MLVNFYKSFLIKKVKKVNKLKNFIIIDNLNYIKYIYFFFEELFYTYSDFILFKVLLKVNKLFFFKVNRKTFLIKIFKLNLLFQYNLFFCIFFFFKDLYNYLNNNLFNSFIINNNKLNYINNINKKFIFRDLNILRLKFLFVGYNTYLYSNLYIINLFNFYNLYKNSFDLLILVFLKNLFIFFFLLINSDNIKSSSKK
jgi:hypothetical protein